jgi:hypothetical protein
MFRSLTRRSSNGHGNADDESAENHLTEGGRKPEGNY